MREIHEASQSEPEEQLKAEARVAHAPVAFDLLLLSLAVYIGLIVYWLWGGWQPLFLSVGFQSFFVYHVYRRRRWARLTLTIIHGLGAGIALLECLSGVLVPLRVFML